METMDMSDPRVHAMLEADKQEALARIRAKKAKECSNEPIDDYWLENCSDH